MTDQIQTDKPVDAAAILAAIEEAGKPKHNEARSVAYTTFHYCGAIWNVTLREGATPQTVEQVFDAIDALHLRVNSEGGNFLTAQQLYSIEVDGETRELIGTTPVAKVIGIAHAAPSASSAVTTTPSPWGKDEPEWAAPGQGPVQPATTATIVPGGEDSFLVETIHYTFTKAGKPKYMIMGGPWQEWGVMCFDSVIKTLPEHIWKNIPPGMKMPVSQHGVIAHYNMKPDDPTKPNLVTHFSHA